MNCAVRHSASPRQGWAWGRGRGWSAAVVGSHGRGLLSSWWLAGGGDGQPQSWPRIAASFPPGVAMPVAGPSRGPNGARLPPAAAASLFTHDLRSHGGCTTCREYRDTWQPQGVLGRVL